MNLSETKLFVYGVSQLFNDNFDQRSIVFKVANSHLIANFLNEDTESNGVFASKEDKIRFRKDFNEKFKIIPDLPETRIHYQNNLEEFFTSLEDFVKNELLHVATSTSSLTNVSFLESGLNFPNFYRFDKDISFVPVAILNSEK
ncbi:hypothetical protein [Pediococcus pentosaceus]|uniref:hypothetical protein n=1 Tax=Pediococcus pentosaceus TaxID=1255 RepID=UPI000E02323C|nr:hypothetical protein [Pediococcus pentosaceus]AXR43542.1 hypothetical protein CKK51_05240 [Pediococcus pentosaceus]KAF0520031.1 hypothetical protein GBP31_01750 [Pediococcus pentosaceus]MBF7110726.1 hypothetical protein [Pediococcus pentosaceus]MBF7117698.1 hypothetical protein [Pediococcus pentosaceus]MCS8577991.1 hypothetical protein [Pediococcus pentosaceus]